MYFKDWRFKSHIFFSPFPVVYTLISQDIFLLFTDCRGRRLPDGGSRSTLGPVANSPLLSLPRLSWYRAWWQGCVGLERKRSAQPCGGLSFYLQLFWSLDILCFQVMLRLRQSFISHSCFDLLGKEALRDGAIGSRPGSPAAFPLKLKKKLQRNFLFFLNLAAFVPLPEVEPEPSAVKVRSPTKWTAR